MLVVALKGADEKLREKMLGCMSAPRRRFDPRRDGRARPAAPRRGARGAEGGARHRPPPRRCRHADARRPGRRLCLGCCARAATQAASLGSFVLDPRPRRASARAAASEAPAATTIGGRSPPRRSARGSRRRPSRAGCEEGRQTVELEFAAERDALARLAESLAGAAARARQRARLAARRNGRPAGPRRWSARSRSTRNLLLARAAAGRRPGRQARSSRPGCAPTPTTSSISRRRGSTCRSSADPTSTRGAIVLETGHGWIEDGPAVRLDRLRAELDQMGRRNERAPGPRPRPARPTSAPAGRPARRSAGSPPMTA